MLGNYRVFGKDSMGWSENQRRLGRIRYDKRVATLQGTWEVVEKVAQIFSPLRFFNDALMAATKFYDQRQKKVELENHLISPVESDN